MLDVLIKDKIFISMKPVIKQYFKYKRYSFIVNQTYNHPYLYTYNC